MDFNRLRQGELIAAGSAVLLLIVMFVFTWFSLGGAEGDAAQAYGFDTGANAWQSFSWIDIVLFITILAAVGLAVLSASAQSDNLPVAPSAAVTVLGGLSTLLILFRIISPPGGDAPAGFDFTVSRGIGVFLGLILAAGIAIGGWMAMQEEGVSFQGEADRFGGGGGTPPPPPPPPPNA